MTISNDYATNMNTAEGKSETHKNMNRIKRVLENTEHQMALDGLTDSHAHQQIVECIKKHRELYEAITSFVAMA